MSGCLAHVQCTVTERVTSDSHIIFIGIAQIVDSFDRRPLAAYRGGFVQVEPIADVRACLAATP